MNNKTLILLGNVQTINRESYKSDSKFQYKVEIIFVLLVLAYKINRTEIFINLPARYQETWCSLCMVMQK